MRQRCLEQMLKGFISTLLIKFRNDLNGVKTDFRYIGQSWEIYETDEVIKDYTDKSVAGILQLLKALSNEGNLQRFFDRR